MTDTATLTRRIADATPAGREREIDALRALAILGVVLGHWLVTAVADRHGDAGGWSADSPLRHLPALTPVSWLLQTLAVFFLVGGYAAARGYTSAAARGTTGRGWLRGRMLRLARPTAAVLLVWTALLALLAGTGAADSGTLRTLGTLVVSPLWFLLVFAGLTAATPVLVRGVHGYGAWAPVLPVITVAVIDGMRFSGAGPQWTGWVNVGAGWLVPYLLGMLWAMRPELLTRRSTAAGLLAGGALACAALIAWCGYPASMVGVPGAEVSNLNPPTLAAVAFGLAQCGAALLLRGPLRRAMHRHPAVWAAVAVMNLSAMTVFLWHQSAMLAVTAAGIAIGPFPGLGTTPADAGWVVARLCWLPVFAAALLLAAAVFHRMEGGRRGRKAAA